MKQLRPDLYAVRGWLGWVHLLVDEAGIGLVDSGFIGDERRIKRAIRSLGYQPGDLKAILLTHGHLDHTMNAAALQTWSGATLYAPSGDELHVEGRYPYCGPARVCGWLETAGRTMLRYRPPRVDVWTCDGDELPFWGGMRVMALPGHTAGHVGFYAVAKRVLFVGDAFAASWRIVMPPGDPEHRHNGCASLFPEGRGRRKRSRADPGSLLRFQRAIRRSRAREGPASFSWYNDATMKIGILGTGWVVGKYAEATRLIDGAVLVAVASRDCDRAKAAGAKHNIPRALTGYKSLINDPEINIVVNALHNGLHCEWSIRALETGKHVLCEKPLACSSEEVERMIAAAHANKRWLMEGFMYRFHPQMIEAKRRVDAGEIGRVTHIRSRRTAFGRDRDNPRYWQDAGGGALMDIGCYCVNLSRFFADAEPKRVEANAQFDEQTGVDLTLTGQLQFDAGVTAEFVCSMVQEPSYAAEITGTEGKLLIPHPWFPPSWPVEFQIVRKEKTEAVRVKSPAAPQHILAPFALEIDHFCRCVRENRAPQFPPDVDAERDSRGNMRVLEALMVSAREGRAVDLPV